MKSRAAIKDVGRTLGFTPAETDALAKLIPNQPNFSLTVERSGRARSPRSQKLYEGRRGVRAAARLRDRARGAVAPHRRARGRRRDRARAARRLRAGLHAAHEGRGRAADDERRHRHAVRHERLEKAGMLKMDFLGLTTLTVIHDALPMIAERARRWTLDLDALPLDDPEVYRMLRAGRTAGVFQFESPLATDMLRAHALRPLRRPRRVQRADAPGPARRRDAHGLHPPEARRGAGDATRSPSCEAILEPTYGVITYQEQVMRIAQVLAGISLAEADVLRKAVGKKDAELIKKELGKFVEKAVARGYDREDHRGDRGADRDVRPLRLQQVALGRLLDHLVPDRVAQGALPGRVHGGAAVVGDRRHRQRGEVHQRGARARPRGAAAGRERVGLQVHRRRRQADPLRPRRHPQRGQGAIESHPRRARRTRRSRRCSTSSSAIDLRLCNKRVFEALIVAGALRRPRRPPGAALRGARPRAARGVAAAAGEGGRPGVAVRRGRPRPASRGALSLPDIPAWTEAERLAKEKEILGFYISGHPLEPFRDEGELFATRTTATLGAWSEHPMTLAAVVTGGQAADQQEVRRGVRAPDGRGFPGTSEVLVFPEAWACSTAPSWPTCRCS